MAKKNAGNLLARALPQWLIIFLAVCGCSTITDVKETLEHNTKTPLTALIVDQLSLRSNGTYGTIEGRRMRLSEPVILERDVRINTIKKYWWPFNLFFAKNSPIIGNIREREELIISDKITGRVIKHNKDKDNKTLSLDVCFDEKGKKYFLTFVKTGNDKEGLFNLKYTPAGTGDLLTSDNSRGTVEYGGKTYQVVFAGTDPYLTTDLVRILDADLKGDADLTKPRSLRGR
ncbi:MAG: hypothetical protein LBG76_07970 [Treponema sp.]|nr:hypothetical protein [Treponema sp.]